MLSPSSSHSPLPPNCVAMSILCVCVSIPALLTGSSVPFFRSPIYALIYDICFSLSDLLHFIRQTLGPSTSLQMTYFRSISWLSEIHCVSVPHLVYSFICRWTWRLFPSPGSCKQCCKEHWSACVFLSYGFLSVYAHEWDCWVIW